MRARAIAGCAALAILFAFASRSDAAEYRYTMNVRIRPLLVFWISRSGVGTAVVTRTDTAATARYTLLIGSDPDRVPRRINRWGYIEEEMRGPEARLLGLMTQSDETSLEEADAGVRTQAAGRHPFRVIQGTVDGDHAISRVATIAAPADYTFRQLESVLGLMRGDAAAGASRSLTLPPGTRPGFLVALADAMRTASATPIRYVYYGRLYEVRQERVRGVANVQIDGVGFGPGRAAEFLVTSLHDSEKTRFSMTYGTEGRFAGVPLAASYQPRWWMQVEITIADASGSAELSAGVSR